MAVAVAVMFAASSCGAPTTIDPGPRVVRADPPAGRPEPVPEPPPPADTPPPDAPPPDPGALGPAVDRPAWLGTRPLPLRPDGFGQIQPTPPELVDRRLATPDVLAPPPDDVFVATVATLPDDVAARSTWQPACPVARADLRYVTVSFWGFDQRPHTGELLVHADVAEEVVGVFRRLHDARFPIEEMRVTRADELDAHPTGDDNNTGGFVCRPSRSTTAWSEHAYGRAVDINPFHNPYVKGDVVLPELASAYVDRSWTRPGMIVAGDVVTAAFADLGWGWGGEWRSSRDPMHFSTTGR
ncbi:MAG: M15 family metallopeptidase [Actinobacteria bacterium]|nr:M15 family metallopeptidase [Actinomycetota bacterium]